MTHFNIILQFTFWILTLFPSLRFSKQKVSTISYLSYVCYMSRPSYSPSFDHPNNILFIKVLQITKLNIFNALIFLSYWYFLLRSKYPSPCIHTHTHTHTHLNAALATQIYAFNPLRHAVSSDVSLCPILLHTLSPFCK
jgi:hypothetical protein